MKDLNYCIFTGRLGADPESRRVRDGDGVVVNMRIACDNTYKDRDGREAGNTEWINLVAFGHAADFADKYLRKGDKIAVRGSFKTRKWQDRDGNDRYSTEIVIDNFNGHIVSMGQGGGGRDDDRRDDRRGGRRDDRNDDDRSRGRDGDDRGRDDRRGGGDRDRRDDRGRGDDRDRGRNDDDRGRRDDDRRDNGRRDSDRRREMDDDIPF